MLELHNGKERDRDDWIGLLKRADPRFQLIDIKQPSGSTLAILEVGWHGGGTHSF